MIYGQDPRTPQASGFYQNGSNPQFAQQSYAQPQAVSYAPPPSNFMGVVWVDGEVGARAYQLPPGWPANTPFPMWDSNGEYIYFKSFNAGGMPNPLQRARYFMEEMPVKNLTAGGLSGTGDYVTKTDLAQLRDELVAMLPGGQSGARGSGNRSERTGGQS